MPRGRGLIANAPKEGRVKGLLILTLLLNSSGMPAANSSPLQTPAVADERESGISFYGKGDYQGAAKVFREIVKRQKDDVIAWHYLGLAMEKLGRPDEARKAHEKAARLGEALLTKQLDHSSGPDYGTLLGSINTHLHLAATSAQRYLLLSSRPSKSKIEQWTDRYEYLSDLGVLSNASGGNGTLGLVYTHKEVTTKVRIISKPEPQYTEEARKKQTTGTVILRAVFAADGKVRAIVPLSPLPNGLTANSIRAARQIRFVPAMKDGKPVSIFLQLEYNFNLY